MGKTQYDFVLTITSVIPVFMLCQDIFLKLILTLDF